MLSFFCLFPFHCILTFHILGIASSFIKFLRKMLNVRLKKLIFHKHRTPFLGAVYKCTHSTAFTCKEGFRCGKKVGNYGQLATTCSRPHLSSDPKIVGSNNAEWWPLKTCLSGNVYGLAFAYISCLHLFHTARSLTATAYLTNIKHNYVLKPISCSPRYMQSEKDVGSTRVIENRGERKHPLESLLKARKK